MADTIPHVSFNRLRLLLLSGLLDVLECIPEGGDPAILLATSGVDKVIPMAVNDPHARMDLLEDFVVAVRLLAMGRSSEEVQRLMAEEGLAQRIVAGDESWAQQYID